MRKLVLLMCFFVLTMYTFNISLFAEDVTASRAQPAVNKSSGVNAVAADKSSDATNTSDIDGDIDYVDISMEATTFVKVKDSFQTYNRAMFTFNDKLYYYFFRPLSKGYKTVIPEVARLGVRNFFTNVRMPGRFFNCIFQGKFKGAGTEFSRFLINSTIGGAGFTDPAKKYFHLDLKDEDFGQTLGNYDLGPGSFLELPFIGPSNIRDAFGLIVDTVLDPVTLLSFVSPYATIGAKGYIAVNDISIDKGDTYEGLVENQIDPYIAIQDAYTQNRTKKIKE
ncbi:surface lipoprotein [Candidatus Scalindua japonica]|uniref:Surface lipoprotein n=1 Tax=Candidatus Scalindua japonica TaxID=1284222 RepID=A0A286TX79_9BACT|nr:VacJ family lipoprotein [Candidatus Scalindua japonica]GAX60495.1 surface lipoprotein [Candidatus Scalindua japonica]